MNNKLLIITGNKGSGKTTALTQIIHYLKSRNLKLSGFIAPGYWKNNERNSFELQSAESGNKILYCSREQKDSWVEVKPFFIDPEALRFGHELLSINSVRLADVVIIDELGPFELQGKGWSQAVKNIIENINTPMIWVVRERLIQTIPEYFELIPSIIYDVRQNNKKPLIGVMDQFIEMLS